MIIYREPVKETPARICEGILETIIREITEEICLTIKTNPKEYFPKQNSYMEFSKEIFNYVVKKQI